MRLPQFLYELSPVGETLRAIEAGETALTEETARHNRQLFVTTAGEEGLTLWERDFSLSGGSSAELRRARIRTALLGGQTLSRPALGKLARLLAHADGVDITEDFHAYHVTLYVHFIGRLPEDLTALREAVKRLAPAHLAVDIVPVAVLHGTLRQYNTLTGRVLLTLRGEAEQ